METTTSKRTSWLFTGIILLLLSVIILACGSAEAQTKRYWRDRTGGWGVDRISNAASNDSKDSRVLQPGDNAVITQSESLVNHKIDHAHPNPLLNLHVEKGSGEIIVRESDQQVPERATMILLGIGLIVGAQFGRRRFLKK